MKVPWWASGGSDNDEAKKQENKDPGCLGTKG